MSCEYTREFPKLCVLISTGAIFAIGLVMIFSTSSAEVLDHDLQKSTHQALFKQMIYACIGGILSLGLWKIGYERVLRASPLLLILFSFLLALALIPGVGREINGSRRWLSLGGMSFQPSEFVKYIVPAFFIQQMLVFRNKKFEFIHFFKVLAMIGIPLLLILIEPNNGTVAVMILTLVMLFLLTKVPFVYWAIPCVVFITIGGIFAYHLPYVSGRLKVYFNPELDLQGKGHQPHQAKIAAGSGKFLGKGPGHGWQKLSYLPEAQNDYIAAIYAEEFGFLGVMVLVFLYMVFALSGFYISANALDISGFYFSAAITFLISLQAFLNLGVVSGIVPSTGLNLPLFSQGGTSIIANMLGISLLLSINKNRYEKYGRPLP
ncbi:MAG TPA: putative peptidoglycan glycosyltransferase FtsW [Waddliaceae bacterium]